jgi:hypothetical protein
MDQHFKVRIRQSHCISTSRPGAAPVLHRELAGPHNQHHDDVDAYLSRNPSRGFAFFFDYIVLIHFSGQLQIELQKEQYVNHSA